MNRRLQQFLELEQLKPAQFADIMGIQRANVSHILSGRNKPSFEFIQKFLMKFPTVNPDWFILGKGKPLREHSTSQAMPLPSSPENLFSEPERQEQLEQESVPGLGPETDDISQLPDKNKNKEVRRITLFYSDGTFQEFYPPK